jgi:phage gp29-like protein
MAFDRASGMFVARAATPPVKTPSKGLSGILLPHARSRWVLPAAAGMTPATIESILRDGLTGRSPRREQELYSLMESTWPRLLKNTEELKSAVLGLEWQVMEPPADRAIPGARELVERAMNGMKSDPETDGLGWRGTLSSLLDAWPRGISISEIEWEYRGGLRTPPAWLPRLTRDLPPWHYGWRTGPQGSAAAGLPEQDGRLVLYPDATGQSGQPFPPNRFLIGIRKAGKGHPSGTALLRCLAWWWCAANFSAEWLLNFAQIFGQPFRWATYAAGQDDVKADLSAMMADMGSAAWGIGPDGTKIEWHEAARSGADNPQAHMLVLADTACDLLLLGQTLTSTQGDKGSQALGTVHQSIRADIIDAAAEWLASVLNEQLIPSIVALNLGDSGEDSALPWFQPARKDKKDTKVLAETFEIILRSGIPLVKTEVYDALDMSQPQAGDEVFQGGAPAGIPAGTPPEVRAMLARLPLDAREYFLARLRD